MNQSYASKEKGIECFKILIIFSALVIIITTVIVLIQLKNNKFVDNRFISGGVGFSYDVSITGNNGSVILYGNSLLNIPCTKYISVNTI